MGKTFEDIEKEFDLVWGEAPIGTPKYYKGIDIKNFLRHAVEQFIEATRVEKMKILIPEWLVENVSSRFFNKAIDAVAEKQEKFLNGK